MKPNAIQRPYLIYFGGDGYPEEADCEQRGRTVRLEGSLSVLEA